MTEAFPELATETLQFPYTLSRWANGDQLSMAEVKDSQKVLWAPTKLNYETIDAFLTPNIMLQSTIRKAGHDINGRGLLDAAKVVLLSYPRPACQKSRFNGQAHVGYGIVSDVAK